MGVIMGFRFMAGMVMVMRAMVASMVMVVYVGNSSVGVLVEMFVQVLVSMIVGVLMAVRLTVMGMFVRVRMSVVMPVQMLVFVLSFHNESSLSPNSSSCPKPFMSLLQVCLSIGSKTVNPASQAIPAPVPKTILEKSHMTEVGVVHGKFQVSIRIISPIRQRDSCKAGAYPGAFEGSAQRFHPDKHGAGSSHPLHYALCSPPYEQKT